MLKVKNFQKGEGKSQLKNSTNCYFLGSREAIFTKFAPETRLCTSWKDQRSDFEKTHFLTPFWPPFDPQMGPMGSNLIFGPIFTKFAPEVHFCPSWKNPKSAFWNFDLLRGQNGVKPYLSAWPYEIGTRGRFLPILNESKVRFSKF